MHLLQIEVNMNRFKQWYNEVVTPASPTDQALDKISSILDLAGLDPTFGTIADLSNAVLYAGRGLAAKDPQMRNQHYLNALISSVSAIPFADVIKLLRAKKIAKNTMPVINKVSNVAGATNAAQVIPRV